MRATEAQGSRNDQSGWVNSSDNSASCWLCGPRKIIRSIQENPTVAKILGLGLVAGIGTIGIGVGTAFLYKSQKLDHSNQEEGDFIVGFIIAASGAVTLLFSGVAAAYCACCRKQADYQLVGTGADTDIFIDTDGDIVDEEGGWVVPNSEDV